MCAVAGRRGGSPRGARPDDAGREQTRGVELVVAEPLDARLQADIREHRVYLELPLARPDTGDPVVSEDLLDRDAEADLDPLVLLDAAAVRLLRGQSAVALEDDRMQDRAGERQRLLERR